MYLYIQSNYIFIPISMSEQENKLINETLESFFENFGSLDIYTKIVLEEFFKEIMNEKSSLHIFGEKR